MTAAVLDAPALSERALDAAVHEYVLGFPHECTLVGNGTEAAPLRLEPPDGAYRRRSPSDGHWDRWSPDGADVVVNAFVPCYRLDLEAAWRVHLNMCSRPFSVRRRYLRASL